MKNESKYRYVLGVDIGTTSCAVVAVEVDKNDKAIGIIHDHVQIFSPPYKSEKEGFVSRAAQRREKRNQRKQIDRKQNRLKALVRFLEHNNICTSEDMYKIQSTPALRARSAMEKISLAELGVVLLRMAKKRGYSGRLNKDDGTVASGSNKLSEKLNLSTDEVRTVGQYLNQVNEQGLSTSLKRHNLVALREQYHQELDKILTTQSSYYPQLIDIKDELLSFFFYQQPLKSSESLVGQCSIEPRHPRALVASPNYQEFRIRSLINDLRWKNSPKGMAYLTVEQKESIFSLLNDPNQLNRQSKITFENIRAHLYQQGLIGNDKVFTHERSKQSSAKGNQTNLVFHQLDLLLDWNQLSQQNQNRVLKLLAEDSFSKVANDKNEILTYLANIKPYSSLSLNNHDEWHSLISFLHKLIEKISNPNLVTCGLESGRATYCLKTLNELHEYLSTYTEEPLRNAEAFLKYKRFELQQSLNEKEISERWIVLKNNLNEDLLDYVEGVIALSQKKWTSLDDYPLPMKTGNPVVDRAMRQTAQVIKSVFKKFGKPKAINIETTRELSFGVQKRNAWEKKHKENERLNNKVRTELTKNNIPATLRNIKKYKVWQEQKQKCPYCVNLISFGDAMNGSETNFEHIQPKSESGIGLRMHEMVIAHKNCNDLKDNRWPIDAFASDPQRNQALLDMISHFRAQHNNWYFQHKAELLAFQPNENYSRPEVKDDSQSWTKSQMQATSWIARIVNQWLTPSKVPLFFTKGRFTSILRSAWQLDDVIPKVRFSENRVVWRITYDDKGQNINVITSENEFEEHLNARAMLRTSRKFNDDSLLNKKLRFDKRVDHRHHAIDALVIALTTPTLLQEYRRSELLKESFHPAVPFESLEIDAKKMICDCNLHHTPDKYPPKAFFKETPRSISGDSLSQNKSIKDFAECKDIKSLESLINKIVSETTKEVFYRHIKEKSKELNLDYDHESRLPKNLNKQICTQLFLTKDVNGNELYAVNDYRYSKHGKHKKMNKVKCFIYTGKGAAKASSAWKVQTKSKNGILHTHAWQVDKNACLLLDINAPEKSRILSNIEYYSMDKPDNVRFIYSGDTLEIKGRKMLVRELSTASNSLTLTDILEASNMKVLCDNRIKSSTTYKISIGKKGFKELV